MDLLFVDPGITRVRHSAHLHRLAVRLLLGPGCGFYNIFADKLRGANLAELTSHMIDHLFAITTLERVNFQTARETCVRITCNFRSIYYIHNAGFVSCVVSGCWRKLILIVSPKCKYNHMHYDFDSDIYIMNCINCVPFWATLNADSSQTFY